MKKNIFNKVLGAMLIIFAVLYSLSLFDIIDTSLIFRGWWTFFIIVPCLISLIFDGFNYINTIGLGIGCIFFLSAQGIISDDIDGKLIFPFIIVVIGVGLIFNKGKNKTDFNKQGKFSEGDEATFYAMFSGNSPQYGGMPFKGCNCYAIFGGMELRLRDANITENCVINTYSVFGGTDILLPNNVKAVVNSTNILGGANNKFISSTNENAPTVLINNTCIFGGLDIK